MALEQAPTAMLILDQHLTVIGVNQTVRALLAQYTSQIREVWPGFEAAMLPGIRMEQWPGISG